MNRELRQFGKGMAFLSPWLIGFLVFTLLPIAVSFYFSLCKFDLLQAPRFIGAHNYTDLLHDQTFWKATWNTFYYTAMALPAGLLVSLGLAMLLNVDIPGQAIWRTIIFMPSLVPIVASAMLWMWLLNPRLGLINVLLARLFALLHLHVSTPPWLADPRWAMPALALMSLWGVGNAVVIYLAGLQDVPVELYEAAELDGAGVFGRIWHVTIPMVSPVIFFNLIMAIIGALQVFDVPYIMTNGGPVHSTYFMSMYLYDNAFVYLQMGYASAIAWIMLLIVLALTGVAFWSSSRWVHYQGK
ncbi:MAG TPA: sugar ABC transporter permease [Tepidisphaeraceae bacterium]|jgi:multiple sugar transport system permease protein|nr:sugar ABC transporter permease [Tepidisphaeraceae bacterium]